MLKNSKMLTITVPKKTYVSIKKEAKQRNETVSGMLRSAFYGYIESHAGVYSDNELQQLLQEDVLPQTLKKDLDRLIKR